MKKFLFVCCAICVFSVQLVVAQAWGGLFSAASATDPQFCTFTGYEGNYVTQDRAFATTIYLREAQNQMAFPDYNDEVRSGVFINMVANRVWEFYDNGSFSTGDDWCRITFKQATPSGTEYRLYSFEHSYEDAYVKVEYFSRDNLDGKISSYKTYVQ
jgi:hypothetical protein